MCYCPTPTLHLNLALTGDGAFLFSLKKTHSVWFISVLNYGDTENVLINHLLLVIPMSYPCHYTNLCPHKPHKHAHTYTHHTTQTHTQPPTHTHTHTHTHPPTHTHTHTHHTHTLEGMHLYWVSFVVGVSCDGWWIYRSMRLESLSCSLSGGNALCSGGNSRLAPTQGGKIRHLKLMSRRFCSTQGCLCKN